MVTLFVSFDLQSLSCYVVQEDQSNICLHFYSTQTGLFYITHSWRRERTGVINILVYRKISPFFMAYGYLC